jgi:transposase
LPTSCRQRRSALRETRYFEPTAQSIANWVHQAERDAGRRSDGARTAEREELIRLRRDNQRLRQERDILSKAAAWFARESKANPNGLSVS